MPLQDVVILAARTLATNIRSMFDDISDVYRCETVRPAVLAIRDSMCCEFGYVCTNTVHEWMMMNVWVLVWVQVGWLPSLLALPPAPLPSSSFLALPRNAVIYQTLSWFLLAFFLCACGIPSAFFGMKRFPGQLWVRGVGWSRTLNPGLA